MPLEEYQLENLIDKMRIKFDAYKPKESSDNMLEDLKQDVDRKIR